MTSALFLATVALTGIIGLKFEGIPLSVKSAGTKYDRMVANGGRRGRE